MDNSTVSLLERRLTSRRSRGIRPHSTQVHYGNIRTAGRVAIGAKTWRCSAMKKYQETNIARAEKEKPLDKFRRIARSVSIISGICVVIKRYAQKGTQMEWETIQTNLKLFAEFDCLVAFNFNSYGSMQPIKPKASDRIRKVLSSPPEARAVKDLQAVKWLLKENDTFQGYPLSTQLELCKCAAYRRYEARRIVVRQGHIPEAFYIVLSGTVMSNSREGETPVVKEIEAGGCFGEKSLLEDVPRSYTVVCKTDVELLAVTKEDFEKIIKGPQLQQKERHLDYLRGLPLFEHFPVEKLRTGNDAFFHKYIRKGKEIATSRKENDFLVVIQSGNCQVITDVKHSKQRPQTSWERKKEGELSAHFPSLLSKPQGSKRQRAKSADVLHWQTGEMRELMKANILTGVTNPDKIMKIYDPKFVYAAVFVQAELALKWIREKQGLSAIQDRLEQLRKQRLKMQSAMAAKQDEKFNTVFADRFAGVSRKEEVQKEEIKKGIGRTLRRVSYAAKSMPTKFPRQLELVPAILEQELTDKRSRTAVEGVVTAQLASLGPGSVFGLEGLFQSYPIDVRLVSDGAECIFLSKKVFLRECNREVLRQVSELVISYPTPEYVQDKLDEERNWNKYKKSVMKDVIDRKQAWASIR